MNARHSLSMARGKHGCQFIIYDRLLGEDGHLQAVWTDALAARMAADLDDSSCPGPRDQAFCHFVGTVDTHLDAIAAKAPRTGSLVRLWALRVDQPGEVVACLTVVVCAEGGNGTAQVLDLLAAGSGLRDRVETALGDALGRFLRRYTQTMEHPIAWRLASAPVQLDTPLYALMCISREALEQDGAPVATDRRRPVRLPEPRRSANGPIALPEDRPAYADPEQ